MRKHTARYAHIFFGLLCSLLIPHVGYAESARDTLHQMQALNNSSRAWRDSSQDMALVVTNQRGSTKSRTFMMHVRKYPDDVRRSIVFFNEPADVKGMGFLQWGNPHGDDQQWLYLPELKRVRQISGGSKTDSFVGSDLSYEDLAIITQIGDWSDTDAEANDAPSENIDGALATVIDMTPMGKKIAYSKIRIWIRTSDFVIIRLLLGAPDGAVQKDVALKDIQMIGSVPTPQRVEVKNLRSGSHTEIVLSNIRYDSGLGDDAFSQRALERGAP